MAQNGAVARVTWIDDAVARLEAAGYREVPTELSNRTSGTMRALRRSDFRISWMFTRLHSFILLWEAPVVSSWDLWAFTADAMQWSRQTKGGWPIGLQTGIAVFTVTVTDRADEQTIEAARRLPDKHWSSFAQPVLVELNSRRAHTYAGPMAWSLIFQSFLARQQANIIGDLAGETMRTRGARLVTAIVLAVVFVTLAYWVLSFAR